ncbi:MAG: Nif3-like dinuclear metal center hexameric protein [Paludibacter sp.]
MKLSEIMALLETEAPLMLQENYDNSGLLIGNKNDDISKILVTIDITEEVVNEAVEHNCNLIISHHPLIFKPIKSINSDSDTGRSIIKLIKNNIAVYAAHTNFDNIISGVNGKIAEKLGLINTKVLQPAENQLFKLITYAPKIHATHVREALFNAGAGNIGNYDKCSYNVEGYGTFRAGSEAHPFIGDINKLHTEPEVRIEVILPKSIKQKVITALFNSHPYEEPAFDLLAIENQSDRIGAGLIGELPDSLDEVTFLNFLKSVFNCKVIKHTDFTGKQIKKVALCGGSGSFLLKSAVRTGADVYVSGDFKYHDFFDAQNHILAVDLGHFESEQYTKHIFYEIITKKMPTFAVRISETKTNPINYL